MPRVSKFVAQLIIVVNCTCFIVFFAFSECKESQFYSLLLEQVLLSPKFISTNPNTFGWTGLIYTVFMYGNFSLSKNFTNLLVSKLRAEFTSQIAKSTSPGLSDTTFFAHCFFFIANSFKFQFYSSLTLDFSFCGIHQKHSKYSNHCKL